MKKNAIIILISLIVSSCHSEEKIRPQLIANNYNIVALPTFTPNTENIIRQVIKYNNLAINRHTEFVIEANNEGFITKTLSNGKVMVDVDYNSAMIFLAYKDTELTYSFLSENGNFLTSLIDPNTNAAVITSEINPEGYITKMEGMFFGLQKYETFTYSKNKTTLFTTKLGNMIGDKFIGNLGETELVYNEQNQLVMTITNNYTVVDEQKWLYLPEKEESKNNTISCKYQNHNQYGDWTSGYCINLALEKTFTFTRDLEY